SEIASAFTRLKAQGVVKYFGVSNFLPSFVSALQSQLEFPLIVNQVEIHLGRLDCFYDGTLDQCLERNITPLSWSPLAGGWIGSGKTDDAQRTTIVELLDKIAAQYGVSRAVLALAWLMEHP